MTGFESSDLVLQNSNFQALKEGKSTELQGLGIGSHQRVEQAVEKRTDFLSCKDSSECWMQKTQASSFQKCIFFGKTKQKKTNRKPFIFISKIVFQKSRVPKCLLL